MKKIMFLLFCSFLSFGLNAQSVIGAWEMYSTSKEGEKLKSIVIFADGYQVIAIYNDDTGEFIHSNGGTWKLEGDTMTEIRISYR